MKVRIPTTLAVAPTRHLFNLDEEKDFAAALDRVDRASDVLPALDLIERGMDDEGNVGEFKLTTWALWQVCRAVCPGLYKALIELTADGEQTSVLTAISILNQTLRLRAAGNLKDCRFLCDRENKTVDAMVGHRYRFFKNLDFYRRYKDRFQSGSFAGGLLNGRWLMARFFEPGAVVEAADSKFFAGHHLSNHEGGQASLLLVNILIRGQGLLGFLASPLRSSRMKHIGNSSTSRFNSMVQNAEKYVWNSEKLQDQIAVAKQTSLGLRVGEMTEIVENSRMFYLVMSQMGITASFIKAVLNNVIVHPHTAKKPLPRISIGAEELKQRSIYDLALSMARCGSICSIHGREVAERAAFSLLSGKIKIPSRK